MTLYHIDFEPVGLRGDCPDDESLLDAARQLGVDLVSLCDGKGSCRRCRVQVLTGRVSEPTSTERKALSSQGLADGYRLACQTYALGDCKLRVPPGSLTTPQRTQVNGLAVSVVPEPPVVAYQAELSAPSFDDLRADDVRLLDALQVQHQIVCDTVDIKVLAELSPALRLWDWEAQASVRGDEVVALRSWPSRQLGLAVDLGTTKMAGYLVDLDDGQTLAARGVMNPQIAYGEDVIARIARTRESSSEAVRLQQLVVEALNEVAASLCAEVGAESQDIVEAVVVGNTAMHHLFLRLPVEQLALSPYVPAVSEALDVKARDVGLGIGAGAYVHLLPNIGGFVGADHVAMLLGTDVWRAEGLVLALDIGTNTEVTLVSNGEMASVSCASGPAFEGAHIKHGMRAAQGAIEVVRLVDGRVEYQAIGGVPPVGVCGSGILDTMAQLYLAGVVDKSGRMHGHPRVRECEGQREFLLISEEENDGRPAISITQRDIREIQLAKGAMRTGIKLLLQSKGRREEEIDRVVIAGAFGTYIDVASAITVGMLPALPVERFEQVGNAAGTGARMALISRVKRGEAQSIARRTEYVELNNIPGFQEAFTDSMYLG